jgi:hypothetical protein
LRSGDKEIISLTVFGWGFELMLPLGPKNIGAIVVCCSLTLSLAMTDRALAQGAPGYRTRPPAAVPPGRLGGSPRPPRLSATSPSQADQRGGRRRYFFPYAFFDGYPVGIYDYTYEDDSAVDYSLDSAEVREVDPADYGTGVKPAPKVQALDDTAAVGRLEVSSERAGAKTLVRLTWPNNRRMAAAQVAFFLADSAKTVLSAQTVRAAPFTAVFEPAPRTAFTGMTVVLPGGNVVTRFLPYRAAR